MKQLLAEIAIGWLKSCWGLLLLIWQQNAEGTITFKLIPTARQREARENRVRVRALFDFTAALDRYIPCKEAGLDFRRGDIIHIVSQDDPYW